MGNILAIIGLIGFVAAMVMLAIRLIAKRGPLSYKWLGFLAILSVVFFFVGAGIEGSSPEFQKNMEEKRKRQAEIAAEQNIGVEDSDVEVKDNESIIPEIGSLNEMADSTETVESTETAENTRMADSGKMTEGLLESNAINENENEDKINNRDEEIETKNPGKRIMGLTKDLVKFTIVEDIVVHSERSRTWAEVKTIEKKDWDDGGWCEEIAKLVILNAWTGDVVYLDEVRVYNADNIQIASMRNWLPKE
jgi:hypothetical protein